MLEGKELVSAGNAARGSEGEIARLEAEIALKRARVSASLGELRRRVDVVTSWRRWAGAHPLAWLGLGLSVGMLVGFMGPPPVPPSRRWR